MKTFCFVPGNVEVLDGRSASEWASLGETIHCPADPVMYREELRKGVRLFKFVPSPGE